MVELPREFRSTPYSYYVWSRSPRAAQIVALAVAGTADHSFRWLTIREAPSSPSEEERWIGHLVPPERVLPPLSGAELGQEPRLSKQTFDSLIRTEGAGAERIALDHFFLLPARLQRVLDEPSPGPGPRAIVCANTNRIRQFYPEDPDALRAYTDVFPRTGISMITTSVPPPYRGRYAFGIVLRIDVPSHVEWRDASLVVEKGLREGKFQTGATFSAGELPWYLELGNAIEKACG